MRCVACVVLFCATLTASAQPPAWVAVKGRVVFPADVPLPVPKEIKPQQAVPLCKGRALIDESVIINTKTRGIKNVVVWLRPDDVKNPKAAFAANEIHPDDAKRKPADAVIDQPCCQFEPRVLAARVGDTVVVKNSATIVHNVFWSSENSGNFNPNIAPKGEFRFPVPLAAESSAISYSCGTHPWMKGWVRVFDHPYFAVTDDDGKFEIKNAPAGKYRVVVWHEAVGFKGGKAGRFGDAIEIKAGMKDAAAVWDLK
jgi:plastocyanin